jgi:hypothetical protein
MPTCCWACLHAYLLCCCSSLTLLLGKPKPKHADADQLPSICIRRLSKCVARLPASVLLQLPHPTARGSQMFQPLEAPLSTPVNGWMHAAKHSAATAAAHPGRASWGLAQRMVSSLLSAIHRAPGFGHPEHAHPVSICAVSCLCSVIASAVWSITHAAVNNCWQAWNTKQL